VGGSGGVVGDFGWFSFGFFHVVLVLWGVKFVWFLVIFDCFFFFFFCGFLEGGGCLWGETEPFNEEGWVTKKALAEVCCEMRPRS